MIPIYICEDNLILLKKYEEYISDYLCFHDFSMKIACVTPDPKNLIAAVQNADEPGIYFLDIMLSASVNGIEAAEQIRKYDPDGWIIFITSYSQMSSMVFQYRVEALDFILKDDPQSLKKRIFQCLETVQKRYEKSRMIFPKLYCCKSGAHKLRLPYEDILYFESISGTHKLLIHTTAGNYEIYASLNDVEKELDERFFRSHKSYLVNTDYAIEFNRTGGYILMRNQERCLLSVRKIRKLNSPSFDVNV